MKKLIVVTAFSLAMPLASAKMLFTIEGGLGYSLNTLTEDSQLAGDTVNLTSTAANNGSAPYNLGMEGNNGFYGWAKFSWPILPDVKVKYEGLTATGTSAAFTTPASVAVFDSLDFDNEVKSELDLSYLDLGLTYGLPLPVVDIDFGLNFRSLIGGFYATSNGQETGSEFTFGSTPVIIPMGYLSAAGTIPGIDVTLSGELSTLPLGETSISDWNVKATWFAPLPTNLLVKLGLEAGYRKFDVTIGESLLGADTSSLQSSLGFSGLFVGAAMKF